jgi:RNA polymerase sigma factor (sigma-70 family)
MLPRGATVKTNGCGPTAAEAPTVSPAVLRVLVANHALFLGFLEKRVGRRDVAEEILQDAFVRSIARGDQLRDDESALAWFYRLLRNALVDHHRRTAAERRGLDAFRDEPRDDGGQMDPDLVAAICACVTSLVDTLKPEYADAIRRVELGGEGVQDWARAVGITPTNAGVRLHRARQALRRRAEQSCGTCADHGCYECECRTEPHPPRAGA